MKSIIKRHIILNVCISNNEILKHMRQKLIEIQGETYTYIISTSLSQYFIEQADRKSVRTWKISGTLSTNKSRIQIFSSVYDKLTMIDPFLGVHNNSQ